MTGLRKDSAAAPRTSTSRVWSFAGCVLDERSLVLKVHDQVADLDRKPLEVLIHLLHHAGEVVTKDELTEAVWPGRIITDSNLTKTMAVLRAALGDSEATVIKTVHGYGYRLMAPVSVQAIASEAPPARFDFKAGESPPQRPHWQLSERLGAGGHGEVWLAHHFKTKEPRVFKFAEAGSALTGLKREVTLYRLLREMLPGREDYLRLFDWNFEEPPFFVESEYAASGNLSTWAESHGGWSRILLATRLELLGQAAEALAAAHSVGVLHKDLKPANILVVEKDGKPHIKLADFGSGGVLDPAALEAHGITRMGFTQTVHVEGTTSGTPLYLAPEVIAGQPFTVQSDIFALGVMLYQIASGYPRKPLAPGWEKDVEDELLREDIAQAAAGDPADRLGDAGEFARRLRSLEERRQKRDIDRAAQADSERARRLREQLRRLRVVATVLLIATAVAVTAGIAAVLARDEARHAAATTRAVSEFLNRDLLGRADPRRGPTRDLTVRQLLDAASTAVDERFAAQPDAAAQVHATLGEAYWQLGELNRAEAHLGKAVALFESHEGRLGMNRFDAALKLAGILKVSGRYAESCEAVHALAADFEDRLAANADERAFGLRVSLAHCKVYGNADAYAPVIEEMEAAVQELERSSGTDTAVYGEALRSLASLQFDRNEFGEAEKIHRKLMAHSARTLGAGHITTIRWRASWVGSLAFSGQLVEADAELTRAYDDLRAWTGKESEDTEYLNIWATILRIEQGRFAEAEDLARRCLDSLTGRQKRGSFRLSALMLHGQALLLQGQNDAAIESLRDALQASEEQAWLRGAYEIPTRAMLADALLRGGKAREADSVLAAITPADLATVPSHAWRHGLFRRSQGLLWLHQGKTEQARAALAGSLATYRQSYGDAHWRTRRAREELKRLGGA